MIKSKKNKFKSLFKFLFRTYRVISLNKSSLQENLMVSFKGYQLFACFLYLCILLLLLTFMLIGYGPLKQLLPQAHYSKKKAIIDLMVTVDSLEKDLQLKSQYLIVLNKIINGDVVDTLFPVSIDSSVTFNNLTLAPSKEDSLLRKMVEDDDLYNIPSSYERAASTLEDFVFFKPVDGLIISGFNSSDKHYGVDIASKSGASVKATLSGVVVFSDWSISNGYMILIQHVENIISVYLHNSLLTKKSNDLVKAGEVIAIVGNSGESSTGPHLHFELWQNGSPVNPTDYIDF